VSKEFDVCVGASHVHDRKAQWRTIEIIATYKKLFREDLRCILPGRFGHGVKTNLLRENIKSARLDVAMPGMVPRDKVRELMNQSHLFVYMGMGGQNDRGPLESLRCGTPVIISNPSRHCPTVYQNRRFCTIIRNWGNNKECALQFKEALDRSRNSSDIRKECSNYFESVNGMETVVIPEMRKLFGIIKNNPIPDIRPLIKEYENL